MHPRTPEYKGRLLLISNSGYPPFEHCINLIDEFLGAARTGFISAAAIADEDGYYRQVKQSLSERSTSDAIANLTHIHWARAPLRSVNEVDAVFVGGGNTFVLLRLLYPRDLPTLGGMTPK